MSEPIDLVLSRLDAYHVKLSGQNRWRACCPGHGGSNRSALSVGVGDNGVVLLRCWQGCEADQIAAGMGLTLEELFPPKDVHASPAKRRRLLTASQALDLLDSEANFVAITAGALATGGILTDDDVDRLLTAAARIATLREECMR